MRRFIVWSAAMGCVVLWGCSSAAKRSQPQSVRAPLKVDVVPRKPFEWTLNLSGVLDRENLGKQLDDRTQGDSEVRKNVSLAGDTLRITGRDAFEAIRPVLARRGLIPANSYVLQAEFLSVHPENIRELGVDWRFQTHMGRASDIVEYAILNETQLGVLRETIRRGNLATCFATPHIRLEDAQHGSIVVSLAQRPRIDDYRVVQQMTGALFVPDQHLKGPASSRISVGVWGHPGEGATALVDLKVSLDGGIYPMQAQIQVGSGPDAQFLPVDRYLYSPGQLDVQFILKEGETVAFTRPHFVYRDPSMPWRRTRQAIILMKLGTGEMIATAKAP